MELCERLADAGCEVNIETNGAVDIEAFLDKIKNKDKIFFTIRNSITPKPELEILCILSTETDENTIIYKDGMTVSDLAKELEVA